MAGAGTLREELEADPARQADAILQLLNSCAGGRDIAAGVKAVCQIILLGGEHTVPHCAATPNLVFFVQLVFFISYINNRIA